LFLRTFDAERDPKDRFEEFPPAAAIEVEPDTPAIGSDVLVVGVAVDVVVG
jgi:hypothetical protein